MSLVLPRTSRTNYCSTIFKSFKNLFFRLILCSKILKSFQNVFFHPRTQVTLCRIHNTVLDDIHNVTHLSTTIIVLSSNSMFSLSVQSYKSFLSNLFHSGLSEFWLRKHSDLMFYLTYQSISIDINVFHLSINTIYYYLLIQTSPFIICRLHIRMYSSSDMSQTYL
jgi:hypothetical protein